MDLLLLLHSPATPIYPQCRSSPLTESIHFVVKAGGRKRRRRITKVAVNNALRLAISLASSFRKLLLTEQTFLDLFLLYGGGDTGGKPPIWTCGGGGRWWRRGGSGMSRSKTIVSALVVLGVVSAVMLIGGRSPERDLGIMVLVLVLVAMGIACWRQSVGFAVLWIALFVFALWSRRGKTRFYWR